MHWYVDLIVHLAVAVVQCAQPSVLRQSAMRRSAQPSWLRTSRCTQLERHAASFVLQINVTIMQRDVVSVLQWQHLIEDAATRSTCKH